MNEINYLNIMLSGYIKNSVLLKLHFIRHQQLEEKNNFLSLIEFYDNCNKVLEHFKQKFVNLFYERKNELYLIISLRKKENKSFNDIEKDIEVLKINDFGIALMPITNQRFTGHLYYSDIEFIENTIKQIFIYVDEKKDYSAQCNEGNFFYSGYENKLYTGREFFEKIYLTKNKLRFPINFPDLIPTYYDLALSEYLENEKDKAESFFSLKLVTIEFLNSEREKIQTLVNGIEDFIIKNGTFKNKREQIKYCKRYLVYLIEKSKELDKIDVEKPQRNETKESYEVKSKHPEFNPNYWNIKCFNLFKYLFENYYDNKINRKLTNIWHYFKECEKSTYNLKCTQKEYRSFLKKEYKIKIGNFTKANKYDSEYRTIDEHRTIFESY